jgi:hypothetical protein
VKKKMLNAAKHSMYDAEEARWMNKLRVKESAKQYSKKMRRMNFNKIDNEVYEDDVQDYLDCDGEY